MGLDGMGLDGMGLDGMGLDGVALDGARLAELGMYGLEREGQEGPKLVGLELELEVAHVLVDEVTLEDEAKWTMR